MIALQIAPTQSDIQQALGTFIQSVLPNFEAIAAQSNQVAEPKGADFVMMTVNRFRRLRTNLKTYDDRRYTGAISGIAMTVSSIAFGPPLFVGAPVYGAGVPDGTAIVSQTSGSPGGVGVYVINSTLSIAAPQIFSSGTATVEIGSEVSVQLDFHSDNYDAAQAAQTVAALFRDAYGVDFFKALAAPMNTISPFYADDPAMRPFINDQQQYEWRWVSEAAMQVNQQVVVGQQFYDSPAVVLQEVGGGFYPP
jgi:hypothetical protein